MTTPTLPPLPEPVGGVMPEDGMHYVDCFTADQMRAYAIAALAQSVPDVPDPMLACEIQPRPLAHPLADYHRAGFEGPLHYTWTDKPHRLLYDLIAAVRFYAAAHPQPAPLTDAAILRIVQRTIHGTTLRLTRDVGPYEVTEPTRDLCMLVRAIEQAHGIVPEPTTGEGQ